MKILYVEITNFGSFFGAHKFQIADRGLVFVCGDNQDEPLMTSNGAGKSTIFDSIDWCLFGDVPKGDTADSVVNEEAGKGCEVTACILDDDGTNLVVTRGRAPKKFEVVRISPEGWPIQPLSTPDPKETQRVLEKELGINREVFHAAVYRAQGDEFDFANATDGERKKLLARIIPELEEVQKLRDRTKELLSSVNQEMQSIEQSLNQTNTQIEVIKGRNWEEQQNAWESGRQSRLDQAMELLQVKQQELHMLKSKLAEGSGLQDQLNALMVPEQLHGAQDALAVQLEAVEELSGALGEAKAAEAIVQKELDDMKQVESGKCTRCGMEVTAEHLEMEIAELEAKVAALSQVRADAAEVYHAALQWKEKRAEGVWKEQQQNQAAMTAYTTEKTKLESAIQNLQQVEKQKTQVERDIMRQEGVIESIQKEKWPGAAQQQKDLEQLGVLNGMHEQLVGQLAALQTRFDFLTFWAAAFGPKGLPSFILDSRLQDLTNAANEWVKALTGGTYWVRFESQSVTQKGTLQEKFNVRVFRHNPDGTVTERNYRSWSGGEKKRVALGIDWGLSCLVASRSAKRWSEYIIDESFRQHIDSGGRTAIFELLEQVKQERSSVFVVDHDLEMAAHFENQVTVRIKNQRSVILESVTAQAFQEEAAA